MQSKDFSIILQLHLRLLPNKVKACHSGHLSLLSGIYMKLVVGMTEVNFTPSMNLL